MYWGGAIIRAYSVLKRAVLLIMVNTVFLISFKKANIK